MEKCQAVPVHLYPLRFLEVVQVTLRSRGTLAAFEFPFENHRGPLLLIAHGSFQIKTTYNNNKKRKKIKKRNGNLTTANRYRSGMQRKVLTLYKINHKFTFFPPWESRTRHSLEFSKMKTLARVNNLCEKIKRDVNSILDGVFLTVPRGPGWEDPKGYHMPAHGIG